MLYRILERLRPGAAPEIHRRAHERGRLLPPGLDALDNGVDLDLSRCFQRMRASAEAAQAAPGPAA